MADQPFGLGVFQREFTDNDGGHLLQQLAEFQAVVVLSFAGEYVNRQIQTIV